MELHLQIPDKMLPFMQPKRHKVAKGGRGGAKSRSVAQLLIARQCSAPELWLCTREIQKSIKDSVHKLLADSIKRLNVGFHFQVLDTQIKAYNGGGFLFSGLQDHTVDSIKSYEGCKGAWVEEAHSVSQRSAEVLVPTIREPGSEIWWTYNPNDESDYVHDRFVVKGDPNAIVVEINWRDNFWFPPELEMERLQLKAINEDLYQHVWEGKCKSLAGLLFKRKWFRFYDALPKHLSVYMSADYAVTEEDEDNTPDYTEFGVWGMSDTGDLYAMDWWSGQEAPETWINAGVTLARKHSPKIWFEEKGVILRALDGAITKRLREKQLFVYRHGLASAGSKAERALGFAARASAGAVYLPRNAEWSTRLLNQLCSFTGQDGKVDDGVDVCSLIARGLDMMTNGRIPVEETKKAVVPFTRPFIEAVKFQDDEDERARREYYGR